MSRLLALAATLALAAPAVQAASVSALSTGLAGADTTITFAEGNLPNDTAVTTQFAAQGVTFSAGIRTAQTYIFSNIDNRAIVNFFPITAAFSLFFTQDVTDATFAMVTNPGTSQFTALLDGVIVETFTAATSTSQANTFYGFTGIVFDEIAIVAGGSNNAMAMDNLSFNVAPPPPPAVPLPASSLLLIGGMGALVAMRRKRSA